MNEDSWQCFLGGGGGDLVAAKPSGGRGGIAMEDIA